MSKRIFRFSYINPPAEGHPRLHQIRDGAAFSEVTASLHRRGYEYGTMINNYPNHQAPAEQFRFLQRDDLLVMTTRPPLSDYLGDPKHKGENKDKRRIEPSNDHLEKAIFGDLTRFFGHVSRYRVDLAEEVATLLPQEFSTMANINFHTKGKATIRSMAVTAGTREREQKADKTFNAVGYFLHLGKVTGYPCSLVLSFSMGGYENLLWNRIVRLRFERWLGKPVFAFALLNLPDEPPQPLTPELADNAPAKILIEHWLDAEGQVGPPSAPPVTNTGTGSVKPATRNRQGSK